MRRKLTGQDSSGRSAFDGHPNPLLRDCDVRQARIKHWVTALLILMVPVSLWIGATAHTDQQQRLEDQKSSIHQVTATTTAVAESTPVASTAGTTTQIWVDNSGDLSMRPLTSSDVVAASIFNTIGSWVLVASVLIGFYHLMRFRYDGRRDARWDRDIADLLRQY